MLIEDLTLDSTAALRYLERWVNDGSPSGFSQRYTTSKHTSPFEDAGSFRLGVLRADVSAFREFGVFPRWATEAIGGDSPWLLIHPDMLSHPELLESGACVEHLDAPRVVATSSGRTVHFVDAPMPDYVKLHYDGILGRVNRRLGWKAAVSGVEVSDALVMAIESGLVDERISLLRETGARAFVGSDRTRPLDWGMTWREGTPWGPRAPLIKQLVPCFSLFASDQRRYRDPPLLEQLVRRSGQSPVEYCLTHILLPIVDCYFSLVGSAGLQPEWNAQNLLIGLGDGLEVVSIVLRDLESVDKDLTIRRLMGQTDVFESCPHKCIEAGQYNYRIKHSFMYDFKLGQYVIEPLLQLAASLEGVDIENLRAPVQSRADTWIQMLPAHFFPEDRRWYGFSPILIDQSGAHRPYVSFPNPPFRSC